MLKAFSAIALAIALPTAAHAQMAQAPAIAAPQPMTCMDHSKMAGMNHMKMDHSQMAAMHMAGMDHSKMAAMDHSKMGSCASPPESGSTSNHQGHSH